MGLPISIVLTNLRLSGFQGFRNLDLKLGRYTVIVGPNCSGKTTILRALLLALRAGDSGLSRYQEDKFDGTWSFEWTLPLTTAELRIASWRDLFFRGTSGSATQSLIEADFCDGSALRSTRVRLEERGSAKPFCQVEIEPFGDGSARRPGTSRVWALSDIVRAPAEEKLLSDEAVRQLQELGRHDEVIRNLVARMSSQAVEKLNHLLRIGRQPMLFKRVTVGEAELGTELQVFFRHADTEFELSSANDGLIRLVSTLATCLVSVAGSLDPSQAILLLDEPESHIHPRLQRALGVALVDVAAACGAQIISVTHSMPLTDAIGVRDGGSVLRLDGRFRRIRQVTTSTERVDAFSQTHELDAYATINFVSSRRILFHEGPTDISLLDRCALALYGRDSERRQAFERWTPIEAKGSGNVGASDSVSYLLSSKLIPRLEARASVIVVALLDRDYERPPGLTERRTGQVLHKRFVWNRHSIESLFLDEDVLTSLLTILLEPHGVTAASLQLSVHEAIITANKDPALLTSAVKALHRSLRNSESDGEQLARDTVRAAPEVWQRGKDRSAFVLGEIRRRLPLGLQREVRATINELVDAVPNELLSKVRIPTEISGFLDLLTVPL